MKRSEAADQPQTAQISKQHQQIEAEEMHVALLRSAHALTNAILAAIETPSAFAMSRAVGSGEGRIHIVVSAGDPASWSAIFAPTASTAARLELATSTTPRNEIHQAGLLMLETLPQLIENAANAMEPHDERALLMNLLAARTHHVVAETVFGSHWEIRLFARKEHGGAVRFALFREARLH